jgi:hypothetical protein
VDDGHRFGGGDDRAVHVDHYDDRAEGQAEMSSLDRVREELAKYEHPFFDFEARQKGSEVEMVIRSKIANVLSPEYKISLNERDLQSSQFRWTFQKLLYDCLTDYVVELFTKSPMTG